jgi:hypothetical protein
MHAFSAARPLLFAFAVALVGCGSSDGSSSGSKAPLSCCFEVSSGQNETVCTCGPAPGGTTSCADFGMMASCTAHYSCCGASATDGDCTCATDGFLSSIGESCSQWLQTDGGSTQQVAACPSR